MTRLDILNLRLDQLSDNLENIENRRSALWRRRKQELKRVLEKYFNVSNKNFTTTVTDTRVSLHLEDKNSSWSIIEAVIDEKWSREDDSDKADDIKVYFNGTSYTNIGEWVLEEAQVRTEFLQCVVDFKDDILAEWNNVSEKYENLMTPLFSQERDIRKAYQSQASDIRKLKDEAMLERLTKTGVEFTKDNRGNLPQLEAKWDWTLRNISKIQVLRTTSSGKSADVIVTQSFRDWNTDTIKETTQEVERVRMDKVSKFLLNNEELIK